MKVPNQFGEIRVKQPNCVFAVKPASASEVVAFDETTGSIKIIYSHGLPYYFFVRKPVCHNYKKREVFYDTVAKINAFWRWIDKTDHFYHDLEGWY